MAYGIHGWQKYRCQKKQDNDSHLGRETFIEVVHISNDEFETEQQTANAICGKWLLHLLYYQIWEE